MRKLTTKEFIDKARVKHGDKYDYSMVEYKGASINVTIKCQAHGEFYQTPTNHAQGKGCPECAGVGKITNEIFIERCNKIHGGKYDYSSVNYSSGRGRVRIKCKEHGFFYQMAESHMSGKGCKKCGGKEKLTRELFIVRSIAVHMDKYDYSKVLYKSAKDKVEIVCKTHGSFMQTPDKHVNSKQGCPKCGFEVTAKRLSFNNSNFISNAIEKHGKKYDYAKVNYKSAHEKVVITCQKHGEFEQTPCIHLRSHGCPGCGDDMIGQSMMKDYSAFINDAIGRHGQKYDYSKSIYLGAHKKILITCPVHGDFNQTPDAHVNRGSGCPKCAIHGFKDNEKACTYVLRSQCGSYLKIGISNNAEERLMKLKRSTPFEFSVIEKFYAIGLSVRSMESKFHKVFDSAGFKGFDGATEWFHYDSEKLEQLKIYGELINEN